MTSSVKSMIAGIKAMSDLTVAAGLARGLIEVAVLKGADAKTLAARAGIDLKDLEDQDNRIPFARYVALMCAGKALCGDPALGLHFGELNDLAQVSIVGLIGNASETMLEAMAQLNRYGRLVIEFDGGPDRFRLAREGGGLWLVDDRGNPNDFHELTESTFARMVMAGRRSGFPPMVKQVHVSHPEPPYADEYARVFQVPVSFGRSWNAMELDEGFLTARLQAQPRYVFGILSERAEALLKELESSKTTRGRVESLLMPVLHKGEASMDAVADKMALSRQTLFRRLKAEGTTFEKVLDELRHRLALHYLGGKKVSVNETAYLVGFSDPAAFSRAFKRWTGTSPRAMRMTGAPR
jgi:AraC-like DNA-binding protein